MTQLALFAGPPLRQLVLAALEGGPLTLRELVTAVDGRDPGPGEYLPAWAAPVNRARQALHGGGVDYVMDGGFIAEPIRFRRTP